MARLQHRQQRAGRSDGLHCQAHIPERQDKIELFYLPSYSPELKPEERLNADLKHAIGTKVPVRTKAKLKIAATEHMVKREQSPERVKYAP